MSFLLPSGTRLQLYFAEVAAFPTLVGLIEFFLTATHAPALSPSRFCAEKSPKGFITSMHPGGARTIEIDLLSSVTLLTR